MTNKLVWPFLFVLIATTGCKKPDSSIGIGNLPEDDVLTLYSTDTLTLNMSTIREDSLKTDQLSSAVLGRVFHPRIGTTTAGFATQLRLSAPNHNFGDSPIADSIFLELRYTGASYGTFTPHYLMIRELVNTLTVDSSYYSNFDPETTHGSLIDPSATAFSIKPTGDTYTETDTIEGGLKIPMNMDFAQSILDLDTSKFASNDAWLQEFPGIVVSSATGYGAAGIDISSGLSIMRLHYHNESDTAFYDFVISPLSARVNMFHQEFVSSLSEMNVGGVDTAFIPGDDLLYVMSGSGLKIKFDIPYLENVNDTLSAERAVQKAELILPLDEHFYDSRYPAHEQLFMMTEDADGNLIATPDQTSNGINIGGYYDSSEKEFHFNISRTVQQILNRNTGVGFGNFSPDRDVPPLYIVSSRAGIAIQGVVLKGTAVDENRARLVLTCSH